MGNENAPHIHLEYHSVVKKNEIMKFAGKQIEKKTIKIILREVAQTQKQTSNVLPSPLQIRCECIAWTTCRNQENRKGTVGQDNKEGDRNIKVILSQKWENRRTSS